MTAVCGVMLGYTVEADIEDVDDQIQAIVKAGVFKEINYLYYRPFYRL